MRSPSSTSLASGTSRLETCPCWRQVCPLKCFNLYYAPAVQFAFKGVIWRSSGAPGSCCSRSTPSLMLLQLASAQHLCLSCVWKQGRAALPILDCSNLFLVTQDLHGSISPAADLLSCRVLRSDAGAAKDL